MHRFLLRFACADRVCTGSLCIWSARFASSTRADLHPSVSTVESKVIAERNKSDIMTKLNKVAYKTILLSSVIMLENNRKKSKRTKWTTDWLLKRENFSHVNLLKELKFEKNDWFI